MILQHYKLLWSYINNVKFVCIVENLSLKNMILVFYQIKHIFTPISFHYDEDNLKLWFKFFFYNFHKKWKNMLHIILQDYSWT